MFTTEMLAKINEVLAKFKIKNPMVGMMVMNGLMLLQQQAGGKLDRIDKALDVVEDVLAAIRVFVPDND